MIDAAALVAGEEAEDLGDVVVGERRVEPLQRRAELRELEVAVAVGVEHAEDAQREVLAPPTGGTREQRDAAWVEGRWVDDSV